ncbi:ATP-binding cassette domain-containing protein [Dehalococcoides mccartyi]|uniref:Peptide ABC transporter, ATP-binding protein n=1 Tax=Dehalococcoides mccartyi (strain ATCC BAA-2266 / KCTC 15142 / 195) TaxID=243164 RepID=Q3Z6F9_DEHM1|nr:ABC transporter ATP-binding protein [Dehalococcoides mccartyi]AAW39322.1 peptide ABC transporter, ATP-binding protein [Dehalococcoides mccartyi 195]
MLKAENLSVHFVVRHNPLVRLKHPDHTIRAVSDVSIELKNGEILGLVGESGSGKTTLARALAGLVRPSGGQVLYRGSDLQKMDAFEFKKYRREVQLILQDSDSTLDPRMRLVELLEEPLKINRHLDKAERQDLVSAIMEKTFIPPSLAGRYPTELSGGQRQRVSLARTLLVRPKIIITDEPLSGLDTILRYQLLKLMLELKEEYGLSYLLISHDLQMISSVCNRVAVMYRGKLVEVMESGNMSSAVHPYTKMLLAGLALGLEEGHDLHHHAEDGQGCGFAGRCPVHLPICHQETPFLKEVSENHLCACHLA